MLRSLIHFWRMNLAVTAGAAVTTAVLTGALLVGDSMRGSLKDLTLDRLGRVEHVLLNDRFFDHELVHRLAVQPGMTREGTELVAAILSRGSATQPDTGRRASQVQILGIDQTFASLYPDSEVTWDSVFERSPDQIFPSVLVNEPLLAELDAKVGDDVLLSFGRSSDVPAASLMGRRDRDEVLSTLRLTITTVLPATGPGGFAIEARQSRRLNAYVEISTLQRRLGRVDQINTILLASADTTTNIAEFDDSLVAALERSVELADLGLRLRRTAEYLSVESRELVLRPGTVAATRELADSQGATSWPFLTYLANRLLVGDRVLPYSTVSAIPLPIPAALGQLTLTTGEAVEELGNDQILLNAWAADDLATWPDSELQMLFYEVGPDDELETATANLRMVGVVSQTGLAADPTLTPEVPGISDADDMAGWDPPFPVDLKAVRPQDEAYWDEFRGTPKAFVNLETGQRLWESRYGNVTSIRILPEPGTDLDELAAAFEKELPRQLNPKEAGFRWLSVRAQGLRSASGTTDFAGLFVGFSLFLIVSALLLVGLLFTLLVEQRAREFGLLLAIGFSVKQVQRKLLAEGGLLAVVGALVGTGLALAYAGLVLKGLETWWSPVVDVPFLRLHVQPTTLVLGAGVSVVLTLLVTSRTVRRLSRLPTRQLLSGATQKYSGSSPRRRAAILAVGSLAVAILLLVVAIVVGMESAPALFFGIGSALVVGGLSAFAAWTRQAPRRDTAITPPVIIGMSMRNSARSPGRSLLCVSLVACASFVLVSVTANRKTPGADPFARDSGTGGLTLVAEADTPLPATLNSLLQNGSAEYFSFRLLPGDDASCLNLYQPEKPRVLGVAPAFIERGGFHFRSTAAEVDNPWTLLEQPLEDGAIPAVGDYNSVKWILHSGLGQDLTLENDQGQPVRLRIVGLLEASIFQSELLISAGNFLEAFSDHPGYAYFVGDPPPDRLGTVIAELELELAPFGLDAGSTSERLAGFQAVESMYLTTFEILGGLGLLLGTLGLGIVLMRNVLERRGELATLRAFGFRRSTLATMVLAENAFLLAMGLLIGAAAGLIAVSPHLISGGIRVPWSSLLLTLTAVFVVGLLASVTAVMGSLRIPLLPALKTD